MIVGIDLGTSTSEIAYINQQGRPKIIPNHLGKPITPSIVHIDENHQPIVGEEAHEKLLTEPENTFIEVKRLMGVNQTYKARGRLYTPVDISAFILKYLVKCAEEFLNEKVERAVITVPAYFTDNQRRETILAGEKAGLKVERIINEPTAAALCYGVNHMKDYSNILVYDLGGGTLDVTVLELFEGVVEVKSSCGNNTLGGKDLNQALINYVNDEINNIHRTHIEKDIRAQMRIRDASESCKISLSEEDSYDITLPFLYQHKGEPMGYNAQISRPLFESLINHMISSTSNQVERALFDADLEKEDLDLVLLIGGSTRVPLVQRFLNEQTGQEPRFSVDPDLGVVYGAAVQAGIIDGMENAIILTDVCPYTLSTEVLNHNFLEEGFTQCDTLIRRNTMIPVSVDKVYCTAHDDQKMVKITAYQGESKIPEENILLDSIMLRGIPSSKAGKEQIKITFAYDLNGILKVSGEIVSNGRQAILEIDTTTSAGISLDVSNWEEGEKSKKYRPVIRKAEKALLAHDNTDKKPLEDILYKLKLSIIRDDDIQTLDALKNDILDYMDFLSELEG